LTFIDLARFLKISRQGRFYLGVKIHDTAPLLISRKGLSDKALIFMRIINFISNQPKMQQKWSCLCKDKNRIVLPFLTVAAVVVVEVPHAVALHFRYLWSSVSQCLWKK
jgi:hypothetical protein